MKSSKMKTFNYAIGMFGTSIPINLLKTYAAIFYVDRMGLTTENFALILFVYTFIDVIDNPVYGFLSDRTRTKWGRRRPWLVIGTPLLVLGLIAFYSTPAFLAGNSLLAWAMLFYIFTGTLDSVINANYAALFPEIFEDDASRAKANALRQAFQLVAMIISIALTPIVTGAIGFSNTSIIYGILGGVVILYMSLTSKERQIKEDENPPKLWNSIKDLVSNKNFWIAGLTNAFYSAAMSLVLAGLPFFVKYTLQIPDAQSTILFASVLLIAIGCVAVWALLVRKKKLIPIWRIALASLAVAFIPLFFANSLITAIISSALVGFGFSGVITTMDLIGARIMDEDTRKHNVRREGIIANALGFMNRLSGLFTSLAFLLLSVLFGFKSGEVPGPQPGMASRFLLTVFPAVLMVISLGFSLFLKMDARGPDEPDDLEIMTDLDVAEEYIMALIQLDFTSETVKVCLPLYMIVPDPKTLSDQSLQERKVLYLLHGLSDNGSAWQRYTNIETIARQFGLVVIMPSIGRSFYTDNPNGQQYFAFLMEELPKYLKDVFGLAPKREDTLIAGNSMGGFGAFKAALNYPERFAAAASLSGVLSLEILKLNPDDPRYHEFTYIFGDLTKLAGTQHDTMVWLQKAAQNPQDLPKLYMACGQQDDLFPLNEMFYDAAQKMSVPIQYDKEDGGHVWPFWEKFIQRFLVYALGEPQKNSWGE